MAQAAMGVNLMMAEQQNLDGLSSCWGRAGQEGETGAGYPSRDDEMEKEGCLSIGTGGKSYSQ